MADMDLEQLRQALEQPGKSKAGLAKAIGRSPSAVTAILKGDRRVQLDEWPLIEQYLEIGGERAVPIVGYVGAGAAAYYYALDANELDATPGPVDATPQTVAVEIRGSSLGHIFDHWLAFYDDVRRPFTTDLLGKLCVVGLSDGRVLIKRVEKGVRDGLYRLVSNGEEAIDNVPIEWAAKVKLLSPKQ